MLHTPPPDILRGPERADLVRAEVLADLFEATAAHCGTLAWRPHATPPCAASSSTRYGLDP